MAIVISRILSPAPLLYTLVVLTQFARGAYVGAQLQFPEELSLLFNITVFWAIGWWVQTDSRRQGVLWVYDLGLFLYIAWPFIMPYYLLKTRGAKGLLVILGFVGAYFGAALIGIILSLLVVTMRA